MINQINIKIVSGERKTWRMIVAIGITFASIVTFGALTQIEVDRIVDNEILMCEHDEDADAIESVLKGRGATDDMLAHSYYLAMSKTYNAKNGSLDSEKFHSAVFGFANVARGTLLTNLLNVATASTNDLNISDAIMAYHGREPSSRFLLQWCINKASLTNCSTQVHATIWGCLAKSMIMNDLPIDIRDDILRFSRKRLFADPASAFEADRILCVHDPLYAKSLLRKQVASRILLLSDEMVSAAVKHYFKGVSKEVVK